MWQPIETAPRDGTKVRLKWRNAEDIGRWHPFAEWHKEQVWAECPWTRGQDGEWSTEFGNAEMDEVEPIGWAPLPEPPK